MSNTYRGNSMVGLIYKKYRVEIELNTFRHF